MAKTFAREGEKNVASNRVARHDYEILRTFETGIILTGTEVKSLRSGRAQMRDSFARVSGGKITLHGVHIPPYEQGNRFNHEPERTRVLLLHRAEVDDLRAAVEQDGLALVPLRIYFVHGLAKVELAVGRGRKRYDKRHALKEREHQREMQRALRHEGRRSG